MPSTVTPAPARRRAPAPTPPTGRRTRCASFSGSARGRVHDGRLTCSPWAWCTASCPRCRSSALQGVNTPAATFACFDVATHGQADHHVARGAEVLHLHLAEVQRLDGAAHLPMSAVCAYSTSHRAAGELDGQVQPARDEEQHRQREGDERDDVQHQRIAHERDVASDSGKNSMVGSGSALARGAVGAAATAVLSAMPRRRRQAARPGRSTPTSGASGGRTRG